MAGEKMKMRRLSYKKMTRRGRFRKRITEYVKPVAVGVLALLTKHHT
jgi:hypothetical protein